MSYLSRDETLALEDRQVANIMDKRYQVFVSSTYDDLEEERREVMHALLELDCIPAGMELFPASSEDQWTLIRKVIDDCDYYMVIVGGRYGSIGPAGLSYTEMEYRYAIEQDKPIIAFLHSKPEDLPAKKTEQTEDLRQRLEQFRAALKQRMCKFWSNPAELGSVVSRSLIRLIKTSPAVGWVRADQLASQDATAEILRLQKSIEELTTELSTFRNQPPAGIEELAQGEDLFSAHVEFLAQKPESFEQPSFHSLKVEVSWNQILWSLGPWMINEASESSLRNLFEELIVKSTREKLSHEKNFRTLRLGEFGTETNDFKTVIIQLRALGLIRQSERERATKSNIIYWTLTPYGDHLVTKLRAQRKSDA